MGSFSPNDTQTTGLGIMKIAHMLKRDQIIPELTSRNKREVVEELVSVLDDEMGINKEKLVEVLLEREKLGSTGIGDGVAIPHGKLGELDRIIASFGRSTTGVDFDSLDGKPSHLFFLLVAPENSAGAHLKALAKISRLFKNGQFRHALMTAKDQDEIYEIILEEDERYE